MYRMVPGRAFAGSVAPTSSAEELDGSLFLELDPHDIARSNIADEIGEKMLAVVHRVE